MPAPTFVASYGNGAVTGNTSQQITITVAAGDLLVCYAGTWDGAYYVNMPTGGGLTWTLQKSLRDTGGYSAVYLWTAKATSAQTFTLTISQTSSGYWGFQVQRWANWSAIGASVLTYGQGTPSTTITTGQDHSALVVYNVDWNGVDGSSHTWLTGAGALTETEYQWYHAAGLLTQYAGYHADTGTAGSKAIGLSAPGGQAWTLIGLEIKGINSVTGSVALSVTTTLAASGAVSLGAGVDLSVSTTLAVTGSASGTPLVTPGVPVASTDPWRSGGFALWYTVDAMLGGRAVPGAQGMLPTGGTITDTSQPGVRRTLNLELAATPGLFDLIAPIGVELTVTAHIRDLSRAVTDVPMGVFVVDQEKLTEGSGKLSITAPDRWVKVQRQKFVGPAASQPGYSVVGQIKDLLWQVIGYDKTISVLTSRTTACPPLVWEKDRDRAILDLASQAGLWVYFDRDGVATIADMPVIGTQATWLLDASTTGVLVSLDRSKDRTNTYNVVVVESSSGSAVPAGSFPQIVWDADPSSPTYAGIDPKARPETAGPFGLSVTYVDTPLPLDPESAHQLGRVTLIRSVGLASQVNLGSAPNPRIDAFDTLSVLPPRQRYDVSRVIEQHVADTVTHPLTLASPMTIEGRQVRTDSFTS